MLLIKSHMKKFDGFIKSNLDNKIEKKLSKYFNKHKITS